MKLILLLSLFGLTACGRIQQGQPQDNGLNLEMAIEPEQPTVGSGQLIFTLTDEQGQPVNGATLDIEGNMTHAGMTPVLAQATSGQNGQYVVPFEWTMGGDWLITVKVSLPDGREFSRQIPVSVE